MKMPADLWVQFVRLGKIILANLSQISPASLTGNSKISPSKKWANIKKRLDQSLLAKNLLG
jgi:hypothetical protein